MLPRISFGAALLVGAMLLLSSQTADSCGTARPKNIITPVEIASESAIILFDEATKTQHFIRRASFQTDAPDFGFLVPTPTQPTLAEASEEAFTQLAKLTEPKVIKKPRPAGGGGGCIPRCGAPAKNKNDDMKAPVEVLEEKRVGPFDTAVLKADDAESLSGWLKKWDYDFSPELNAWVEPYVKQGWIITAFKIARDNPDAKRVASTAVRMTFKTEKPFYPYREPEDQRPANKNVSPRLLRVFYLGESRVQGTFGDKDKPWPGKVVWANKVAAADREKLLEVLKLPKETAPANWHLTEFEDHSTPRPGTDDVYFGPSDDQAPVERPPSIIFAARPFPDDTVGYALVACVLVPWGRRRWRAWRGQGK
jgi:Uncharacterized protein conserved in bacteria (DUF2330)